MLDDIEVTIDTATISKKLDKANEVAESKVEVSPDDIAEALPKVIDALPPKTVASLNSTAREYAEALDNATTSSGFKELDESEQRTERLEAEQLVRRRLETQKEILKFELKEELEDIGSNLKKGTPDQKRMIDVIVDHLADASFHQHMALVRPEQAMAISDELASHNIASSVVGDVDKRGELAASPSRGQGG